MKKILIPISNSFFVRNFLRTDFFAEIKKADVTLILLAPKQKLEYYKKEFGGEKVIFEPMPELSEKRFDKMCRTIELLSIHGVFTRSMHFYYLFREGSQDFFLKRIIVFCIRMMLWFLGQFKWYRSLLRYVYNNKKSDAAAHVLEKFSPDLIFCPTLIFGVEYPLLKEAKRKGITTIGMTSSWDNLYSKTFFLVFPDTLLVQTHLMKKQAIERADFPARQIVVTGVPQYDNYLKDPVQMSRDEFVRSIGGDPTKKIILYAYSGKISTDIDHALVATLYEMVKGNEFALPVQVFVRPYPKRDLSSERIQKIRENYGFITHNVVSHIGEGKDSWEFDKASLQFLKNTLAHADVVLTCCSTFFNEAALFDRPLIAVAFDGSLKRNYWNSARRFFEWEHLQDLSHTGGVVRVKSKEELRDTINTYLSDPQVHSEGRKRLREEQSGFLDGKSGIRIAEILATKLRNGK